MDYRRAVFPSALAGLLLFLPPHPQAAPKKRPTVLPPVPNVVPYPLLRPGPLAYWPDTVVPPPDPVQKLIEAANQAYENGVQAYNSGHLVKAKAEFDRAVDMILQSGLDLSLYPGLEKEFDRLLDNIHNYELAALKEGDGFTEQKAVSAPIDEIADLTFPVDPALQKKLAQEVSDTRSDLPLVINDYVLGYINYFSGRGKATIMNGLRRAGRYRDMIERVLQEEGVPQDLLYLAQAESSFEPLALSRVGARGIWQFMPARGREYGLERNWWVDFRQDPEKSTRAAARHLRDLYNMFGDWYLAMAAYNSGPAHVQSAVERSGYADFWELYRRNLLPRETKNYVPIILATTIMAKNPAQYGLSEVSAEPAVRTDSVHISTPTDLRLIAETIDCSVGQLQELNPSLLRWVTPKVPQFELKLPAGTGDRFLQGISLIPENKRVWWRWHRVASGDTLEEIARNFKTTPGAIAQVNNLALEQALQLGTKLVIPIAPKDDSLMAAALGGQTSVVRLRYRSRKGDTVARVADRFGVTVEELRQWNRLRSNHLRPGRVLMIRASATEYRSLAGHKSRSSRRTARKSHSSKKMRTVARRHYSKTRTSRPGLKATAYRSGPALARASHPRR